MSNPIYNILSFSMMKRENKEIHRTACEMVKLLLSETKNQAEYQEKYDRLLEKYKGYYADEGTALKAIEEALKVEIEPGRNYFLEPVQTGTAEKLLGRIIDSSPLYDDLLQYALDKFDIDLTQDSGDQKSFLYKILFSVRDLSPLRKHLNTAKYREHINNLANPNSEEPKTSEYIEHINNLANPNSEKPKTFVELLYNFLELLYNLVNRLANFTLNSTEPEINSEEPEINSEEPKITLNSTEPEINSAKPKTFVELLYDDHGLERIYVLYELSGFKGDFAEYVDSLPKSDRILKAKNLAVENIKIVSAIVNKVSITQEEKDRAIGAINQLGHNLFPLFSAGQELIAAIKNNHSDIAKAIINKEVDVNAKDKGDGTALIYAAKNGNLEIAELLIKKGADLHAKDWGGQTALDYASTDDIIEIIQAQIDLDNQLINIVKDNKAGDVAKVLAQGARVNAKDKEGNTALIYAAENGHVAVAQLLIDKGAKVDAKGKRGETALMWATFSNRLETAKLLIEKGADVNEKDKYGKTALMFAAEHGHVAVAKLLIDKGADVNEEDKRGGTALMLAAENGELELAKLLIENRADVDKKNHLGDTALMLAAWNGKMDIAKLLIEKGASINGLEEESINNLLNYATVHNEQGMFTKIINQLPSDKVMDLFRNNINDPAFLNNLRICSSKIGNILLNAHENGNQGIIDWLVNEAKVDYNLILPAAARNNKLDIVKDLLQKKVVKDLLEKEEIDKNCQDDQGNTALSCIVKNKEFCDKNYLLCEELIDKTDSDIKYPGGKNPLIIAIEHNNTRMVGCIMNNKPKYIEQVDERENNFLHHLAMKQSPEARAILSNSREYIQDYINKPNKEGKTPLTYMIENKQNGMLDTIFEVKPIKLEVSKKDLEALKKTDIRDSIKYLINEAAQNQNSNRSR